MMPNPLWLEQLLDDRRTREVAADPGRRGPRPAKHRVSVRDAAAAIARPIRDAMGRWREPEPTLEAFERHPVSPPEGAR